MSPWQPTTLPCVLNLVRALEYLNGLDDLADSIGGIDDIKSWRYSCTSLISRNNLSRKRLHTIASYKVYSASAEAAARHSCSENLIQRLSNLKHQIQFDATHFVIVLKRSVRFGHQRAHRFEIASP